MDPKILGNLSYGVYVISTLDQEKYAGCLANSVIQISSKPYTVLVSMHRDNYTNVCIKKCKKFGISILNEETDLNVIGTFGFQSSKSVNKFHNIRNQLIQEVPILTDSCGYIICSVVDAIETSTHTLFIGEVEKMGGYNEKSPMTYRYYHEVLKGTTPKNAPTYIEQKNEEERVFKSKKKWKCKVCGYIYEAEEIPKDFLCPICGQPHTEFVLIE